MTAFFLTTSSHVWAIETSEKAQQVCGDSQTLRSYSARYSLVSGPLGWFHMSWETQWDSRPDTDVVRAGASIRWVRAWRHLNDVSALRAKERDLGCKLIDVQRWCQIMPYTPDAFQDRSKFGLENWFQLPRNALQCPLSARHCLEPRPDQYGPNGPPTMCISHSYLWVFDRCLRRDRIHHWKIAHISFAILKSY